MEMETIGRWCFLIGIVLAIILGLFGTSVIPMSGLILVILGLIVGFLNVTSRETTSFLVAAIALLVVAGSSGLSTIPTLGTYLEGIVMAIAAFTAPVALVVAIKAVVSASRD